MDFIAGEILLFDKPFGWTSFQLVNKVRYLIQRKLGIKKLKVGHAGTLDPLATGLMVICTGKKTKEIQHFLDDRKEYTGTFHLGATTPSFDLETAVSEQKDISFLTNELIIETAKNMLGEQLQTPPVFSAKKIDGKRAYDLARMGKEVEMKRSLINVYSFQITGIRLPEVDFHITCSKGTYIRSMANDFGVLLGCGAYLKALRRVKSGEFSIDESLTLTEFESRMMAAEDKSIKS